jgi:hypothetical protein
MNFAELQAYVASLPVEEREALDNEGLRIHDSLSPGGYDSSPPGYLAFASTGGDGVHFSFPSNQFGPVVMTVPMAFDRPNIVVGADLKDFLSLGCMYGFFVLEQLGYNDNLTIDPMDAVKEASPALQRLSRHFGLRPWPAVGIHLAALQVAHPIDPI